MKKLLTLLTSVSLVATTSQIVVACTSKYDQSDADGNSILVHFLEKLDGKAEIGANDILDKLINVSSGVKNREKFSIDLLKMINLSLLANAESNYSEGSDKKAEYNLNKEHPYYINGLEKILVDRWKTLSADVDRQIQNEKDKYKNDYAGKWENEWNSMLVNKFSVYQKDTKDMDRDFLEKKYKADILMNDSSNNVSKILIDILLNTDQQGVTWVSRTTVQEKYRNLKAAGDDENKVNSILASDQKMLNQIYNSSRKSSDEWTASKYGFEFKDWKEVQNEVKKVEDIKTDVPLDLTNFTVTDAASRKGFISNSQRFFMDKWYTNQAPLALSEITIPFADEHKFEDGISLKSFESTTYDKYQKDIIKLLKSLQNSNQETIELKADNDTSNSTWRKIMSEGSLSNTINGKATVKKYDKLLTLSNSSDFTQDIRTAVYDYVLNKNAKEKNFAELKALKLDENDVKTLGTAIENISRKSGSDSSKFYGELNDGRLLLIDTSGLHIINIDGYNYLSNDTEPKDLETNKGIESGTINNNTRKELEAFKDFHKLTNNEKIAYIQSGIDDTKYYDKLNTHINNNYLKYLANTSLIKGIDGAATSFDLMEEVKEWVKVESSTDISKYSWSSSIFDYFKIISTNNPKQEDFVKQFVVFNSEDEVGKSLENRFNTMLNTLQSIIDSAPPNAFINEFNKRNEEILKQSDKSDYPKKTIKNDQVFNDNLKSIANKVFWKPGDKKAEKVKMVSFSLKNDFVNNYFNNMGKVIRGDE
ncbi:hypothetical protein SLITO_v1c02210 [Spiroplasma litorale]|uniref:Lipoprotein n=1 Tax=Spiroplasma litorale TaxID=216942 RepID=A0A0K1W0P0_9MOLU|nr:lipoprotein [Spiroplasma litorale]AKX33880.1 hypothetical protein SLITO_v1c02210 [Spiroplasma litorale]